MLMMTAASISSASTFFFVTKKMSPEFLETLTTLAKLRVQQLRQPASACPPEGALTSQSLSEVLNKEDLANLLKKMQEAHAERNKALDDLKE
jgi:hypothetical protein